MYLAVMKSSKGEIETILYKDNPIQR